MGSRVILTLVRVSRIVLLAMEESASEKWALKREVPLVTREIVGECAAPITVKSVTAGAVLTAMETVAGVAEEAPPSEAFQTNGSEPMKPVLGTYVRLVILAESIMVSEVSGVPLRKRVPLEGRVTISMDWSGNTPL